MWFKNLTLYRLPRDWSWSAADLEDQLWSRKLRECSALEMFNRGWLPPAHDDRLVYTLNRQHLIALGTNQKLLPGSIVKQHVQERAKDLEKEQGHPVARRQLREIKESVVTELRAKALTRRKIMRAWIDPDSGWLVIDTPSVPRAEELVETLRDTLGSFAATLINTERSPQSAMSTWLLSDAPGRFTLDDELELQAADKTKALVRYQRHPLDAKEIKPHLSAGKMPTRLGLTWSDRIGFAITDKLQLKRLDYLAMNEGAAPGTENAVEELSAEEKFAADFALMTGELGGLIKDMLQALGAQATRAAA